MRLKAALLDQIGKLQLPTNFLDELIHQLGGPDAVAECTGRKGRIVADSAGRCCYGLGRMRDYNRESLAGSIGTIRRNVSDGILTCSLCRLMRLSALSEIIRLCSAK